MNNKNLYETEEVFNKYSANSTRLRTLNNSEKYLVDKFDIKNKNVLVLGCGAGRVPINLLLFGNKVVGVDRSEKLITFAKENFSNNDFRKLDFILSDMCDLSKIENEIFDVVIIPMNSIDYLENIEMRECAIKEANLKLKKGGILAISSHNKLSYLFSYKIPFKNKRIKYLLKDYIFSTEKVIGGGFIFKGNPKFVINHIQSITKTKFIGFTVDSRNKIERVCAKSLFLSKYIFPYIFYVFKKD